MHNFKGFDKNTCDFLFGLQFCNTIANQGVNILKYKKYITEPLNLLYCDLFDVVDKFDMSFETKPQRCISTPYTDRRFSPTVPLKEYMYLRFRQAGRKTDRIGLYFDMGCYGYGLQIYKPTANGMDIMRNKISNNAEEFSELIDKLTNKGFEMKGAKYKKDHYPGLSDYSAKEILNRKSFNICKVKAVDEMVFSDKLFYEVSEAFFDLKFFAELLAK